MHRYLFSKTKLRETLRVQVPPALPPELSAFSPELGGAYGECLLPPQRGFFLRFSLTASWAETLMALKSAMWRPRRNEQRHLAGRDHSAHEKNNPIPMTFQRDIIGCPMTGKCGRGQHSPLCDVRRYALSIFSFAAPPEPMRYCRENGFLPVERNPRGRDRGSVACESLRAL